MGLTGILAAAGIGTSIFGDVNSMKQTDKANQQAQQTLGQETNLLAEANQQLTQYEAMPQMLATRTAEETLLGNPGDKFNADNTLLTAPKITKPGA